MTQAISTVNGVTLATTGVTGLNVVAGSTITIALAAGIAAQSYYVSCTSADGYNPGSVPATINATAVYNPTNNSATFVVPSIYNGVYGASLQFTCTLSNTDPNPYTLGVFVLCSNGSRLPFINMGFESNATFGAAYDAAIVYGRTGGGGSTTLSGDVTGSVGSNTVTKLYGKNLSAATPVTDNMLVWNGTAWTPYSGNLSITGDVSAAGSVSDVGIVSTNSKVTGLQGNPIQNQGTLGASEDGYVLTFSNGIPGWNAAPAQATTSGGDLSGLVSSAKVVGIDGYQIATPLLLTSATDGYVLTYTNSTGKLSFKLPPSGSFAAGGDLSGTSSAQTVIGIDGYAVNTSVGVMPGQALQLHTDNKYHPEGIAKIYNVFSFGAVGGATRASPTDNLGIQAAINAASGTDKLLTVVLPANTTYNLFYPLFITNKGSQNPNLTIMGEHPGVLDAYASTIQTTGGFLSDAIVSGSTTSAMPTIDAYSAGTGTVNLIQMTKSGGNQPAVYFTETVAGHVGGFAQLQVQCFYKWTGYPLTDYCWIIGSSGSDGYTPIASAFVMWINPAENGLTCQITTTAGQYTVWSKSVPTNAVSHLCMSYDGSFLRMFINGQLSEAVSTVSSGPVAATGTIVQQTFEDLTIGAGLVNATGPIYGQYPFTQSPSVGTPSNAGGNFGIGNIVIDAYARNTTSFAFPTQNVAPIYLSAPGTTLICNFDDYVIPDPLYVGTGFSGVINSLYGQAIPAMVVAKSFTNPLNTASTNTFGYGAWYCICGNGGSINAGGYTIKDLKFTASNGGGAIRASLGQDINLVNLNIQLTGRGITMINNCINCFTDHINATIGIGTWSGGISNAQSWAIHNGGGAANQFRIDNLITQGSVYGVIFNGAGLCGMNNWIECNSAGGSQTGLFMQCQNGNIELDGWTIGDDNAGGYYGHGWNRAGIVLNAGSGEGYQAVNLIINGSNIISTANSAPCMFVNQANAICQVSSFGTEWASIYVNPFQFAASNTYAAPFVIDYNTYNQTIAFITNTGYAVPPTKVIGYDCIPSSTNFTSNAAMTLPQDAWLHYDVQITDTHPYLTGTTTVNVPFLFNGIKRTIYNFTAQTLILKWVGGTGSTGLSIGSRGGGTFTSFDVVSDGTNLHQTTAQFNAP